MFSIPATSKLRAMKWYHCQHHSSLNKALQKSLASLKDLHARSTCILQATAKLAEGHRRWRHVLPSLPSSATVLPCCSRSTMSSRWCEGIAWNYAVAQIFCKLTRIGFDALAPRLTSIIVDGTQKHPMCRIIDHEFKSIECPCSPG